MSEQDIDLRKLRYFLAVATESNFGRAAARLHMTQPALSRQIQSLETEVGVRLFDRDRQGARLTSAGEQFRKDAEQLLELSVAAQRRARQAARSPSLFSVGFMPGVPSTPIVREFGKSVPRLEISVVYTALTDQVDYLLDGRWTSASSGCRSRRACSRSCPCSWSSRSSRSRRIIRPG